ncbi:hypothetical protein D915_008708 [Fasciola hepatica]|uniref:Uncharacterized protein n=1 Tax=Fasciola hepatica TaxID=6192 RepID=A0A4E0RHE3_FASHE|nr:hypothetical protein D915_008708 [Fasciola hepatica]
MSVASDIALYELSLKAGLPFDKEVFRHIHALLTLGCNPDVIYNMLRQLSLFQVQSLSTDRRQTGDQISNPRVAAQSNRSDGAFIHPRPMMDAPRGDGDRQMELFSVSASRTISNRFGRNADN